MVLIPAPLSAEYAIRPCQQAGIPSFRTTSRTVAQVVQVARAERSTDHRFDPPKHVVWAAS